MKVKKDNKILAHTQSLLIAFSIVVAITILAGMLISALLLREHFVDMLLLFFLPLTVFFAVWLIVGLCIDKVVAIDGDFLKVYRRKKVFLYVNKSDIRFAKLYQHRIPFVKITFADNVQLPKVIKESKLSNTFTFFIDKKSAMALEEWLGNGKLVIE